MPRSLLLALSFLAAIAALAQPNPYGCHFFKHAPQIQPLSSQQRSDITATIARSDTFDIRHYDIHLDVTDHQGQMLRAATTITYRALMADQGMIRFDLFELEVDSVIGEDGPLLFAQDDEYLSVYFQEAPVVGEDHELTVHYHGTPHRDPQWGGFYFQQGYIYNLGIGISTIPPNFGKVWYPCFDSFVERATYSFHVKTVGTYTFHGQGSFLGQVQLGGDTIIRSYALEQAIPTHISAVAISHYATHAYTHTGASGDIPVTLIAKPGNLDTMVARFGDLGSAIDVCEYWYGHYPYERVGYVHTVDGALEIPTNVAYPDFMNGQSVERNRALYTHELGHHWWGDMVTPHVHNDMWLKEGPAEYSGHLVEEWMFGHDGLVKAVKDNLIYVLRQAHLNDDGFHALSPMPDEHIYGSHTYYKGALVMHNMRGYVGDSLFQHAMHSIQNDMAHTTMTPEDLRDAVELYTGVDMVPFFDAWVFAPSYSVFEVITAEAASVGGEWSVQLGIAQKLRGGDQLHHAVPLDLTFISADGQVHDQRIMAGGDWTTLEVSSPFEPAMVVLNRYAALNQARLDEEVTWVAGDASEKNLEYAELRVYCDGADDDVLMRVEHMWVAPDQDPLSTYVDAISGTHYWNVDGLWQEGAPLRARVAYAANVEGSLDQELVAGNEAGICVLYRPDPQAVWEVYPHQLVNTGNLLNGFGSIEITELRRGQYALGKTNGFVNIGEALPKYEWSMSLAPVPASQVLTVNGHMPGQGTLIFDIFSMDGSRVARSTQAVNGQYKAQLDVSRIPAGNYILRAMTTRGEMAGSERFEVVR